MLSDPGGQKMLKPWQASLMAGQSDDRPDEVQLKMERDDKHPSPLSSSLLVTHDQTQLNPVVQEARKAMTCTAKEAI